jgi:L-malate glycosyltransferase
VILSKSKLVVVGIPCLLRGGTEMQTLCLVKVLKKLGHAVIVLCYFESESSVVEDFRNLGVDVKLLQMNRKTKTIRFIYRMRNEIKKCEPDIVHIQYIAPGALPIIAARLSGIKTVFATIHQPFTSTHHKKARIILRLASFLTTKFIAVSQSIENSWFGTSYIYDLHGSQSGLFRHCTIYNAVDVTTIHNIGNNFDLQSLKNSLKIPSGTILIGCVSRLRNEKGIDILIDAFKFLIDDGIQIHLLVVGSGPDEQKLKFLATFLGISDRITFYGGTTWEQAIELMTLMDVVIVPSRFEGFGLSAAEAMAATKPVIASNSFGLQEVVTDGITGLFFSVGNCKDLAIKIKILIFDFEMRKKLGEAGYEKVNLLFNLKVFSDKISSLYNN